MTPADPGKEQRRAGFSLAKSEERCELYGPLLKEGDTMPAEACLAEEKMRASGAGPGVGGINGTDVRPSPRASI